MANIAVYLLVGMMLTAGAGVARADTLLVENLGAAAGDATERPSRGLSMTKVEARWGAPENRSGPVGKPPITRWDYPGFVVFFEHQHVVHAVRRAL